MASSFMVGESLVGEGNEVAHIDLVIGSKDGPVGEAFTEALVNQKEGHTNLLAVVAPNLPAKPDTVMSNKVTIKGATQAVQMFGPAQAAVARAVVDSVREGVIAEGQVDDLCILVGVFIHWEADRRQEDLRLQLPGDQGVDRPGAGGRADDRGRPQLLGGGAPSVRRRRGGLIAARLAGARVVVTGASSGIGRAIAEAFAGAGADVLATYRGNEDGARELAERTGAQVAQADLATHAGVRGARGRGPRAPRRPRRLGQQRRRRRPDRRGGRLGVGAQARPPARRRPQGHDRVLVRRRRGHARAADGRRDPEHELGPRRRPAWRATTRSCSAPSRAACSRSARASPARSRRSVRVNVLCPGWIETAFASDADREFRRQVAESTPLGRWGRPEDVAAAAALARLARGRLHHGTEP